MTRILILGAGAIGGYYGGRLAETGHDVTFLVRPARQKNLEENGLTIESPAGNAHLNVKTITNAAKKQNFDFILLTCKSYDLLSAISAIEPFMGENTILMPTLNGMAHMQLLNENFGKNNIMAGSVFISATMKNNGNIQHLSNEAYGFFGIQDGGLDARASQFSGLFDHAKGLKIRAVDDAMQRMWDKWVLLAALAGMTCLMRANIGEICRAYGGLAAMTEFCKNNNLVATAEGYPLDTDKLQDTLNFLTNVNSLETSSMLRDIKNRNQTEADHILGNLLVRAQKYEIPHPILSLAYTHLKAYEQSQIDKKTQSASPAKAI